MKLKLTCRVCGCFCWTRKEFKSHLKNHGLKNKELKEAVKDAERKVKTEMAG